MWKEQHFFFKKRSKKFLVGFAWALAMTTPKAQINKSFLRRFFSKKRLAYSEFGAMALPETGSCISVLALGAPAIGKACTLGW